MLDEQFNCSYGYDMALSCDTIYCRACVKTFTTMSALRQHQNQWCNFREAAMSQSQYTSAELVSSNSSGNSTQILSNTSITPPRQFLTRILTDTPIWYVICFDSIGLTFIRNESPILLPLEDVIHNTELINFQQQLTQQQPNLHAAGLQSQGPLLVSTFQNDN